MESIEEIGFGGLKLIQSSEGFRFGIDAVLLADFAAGVYWKTQNNLTTCGMTADSSSNETASEDFMLADWFGTAEGYSMGYELSLRKDRGALFGGVNWSQSLSVLRTDDGSKPYFPSWHQPYALKFDAGVNWKGADGIWPHRKKGRAL